MKEEFGVEPEKLTVYQERLESIGKEFGYQAPSGVTIHQIPPDKTIATMLAADELDGAAITIAGTTLLVRTGVAVSAQSCMRPLFPDPVAENARYFQKTGISPRDRCVAVRKSVLERHPWVALNHTQGGLNVNTHGQVLRPDRSIILCTRGHRIIRQRNRGLLALKRKAWTH